MLDLLSVLGRGLLLVVDQGVLGALFLFLSLLFLVLEDQLLFDVVGRCVRLLKLCNLGWRDVLSPSSSLVRLLFKDSVTVDFPQPLEVRIPDVVFIQNEIADSTPMTFEGGH